jgi:glycosyltransferase involved in cell wall biosynthesis
MSAEPRVSVVMPVYNEGRDLKGTLDALTEAARNTPGFVAEVLVVDDGSTDDTADVAEAAPDELRVRVISQVNSGRFAARLRGVEDAQAPLVLFLDARVRLSPTALAFVAERLREDPSDDVWNAHVEIATDTPYGRFWNALTEIAFGTYFDEPRTTKFDAESFELYPKGTTCFLAPRELILKAAGVSSSYYADLRHANDDTLMLRRLAELHPIAISPAFSCRYRSRDAFVPFVRHAYHRGIVFLDGHGRRGARLAPVVVLFYPLSLVFAAAAARRPGAAAATLAVAGLGAGALAVGKGRSRVESVSFASLAPVYLVAHGAGMWRGLLAASMRRRKTSRR